MNWDSIKDHSIWIIGVAFAAYEIYLEIKHHGSVFKILALFVLAAVWIWLGIDQNNRNSQKEKHFDTSIDQLHEGMNHLQEVKTADSLKYIRDSTRNAEFQAKLFNEFKITRDSINNKPVKYEFNTNIRDVENLRIGPG
jgi:hypothetical protein